MTEIPALEENAAALRRALLSSYDANRRELPWRFETDPYRIWVSEVMLQQTRVETVLSYYRRWIERFPDVHALAAADVDDALKLWEGLGYYRRARFLHQGARFVRERHGGALPSGYDDLRAIPGVGPYTAAAVASIAFGVPVPAVDGNVRRVLSRLFDLEDASPATLGTLADALVDPGRPGDWNQALMEHGATVCTPRRPRCETCPVADLCRARERGTVELRPGPTRRGRVRRVTLVAAVFARDGRVLLERRPDEGLLGGMWSFPVGEMEPGDDPLGVVMEMAGACHLRITGTARALDPVRHRFSHLDATYRPVMAPVAEVDGVDAHGRWVRPADPGGVALPVAQQKIMTDAAVRLDRRHQS